MKTGRVKPTDEHHGMVRAYELSALIVSSFTASISDQSGVECVCIKLLPQL